MLSTLLLALALPSVQAQTKALPVVPTLPGATPLGAVDLGSVDLGSQLYSLPATGALDGAAQSGSELYSLPALGKNAALAPVNTLSASPLTQLGSPEKADLGVLKPTLDGVFDRALSLGAPGLLAGPEDPTLKPGSKDQDGNPAIDPDNLDPLLPSNYDKGTWTGRISMHMHSYFSDGTMSPEEMIQAAYDAGVRVAALTDHDTTVGIMRAFKKAKELGMEFHPGIELSARGGAHIGALDVDIDHPKLVKLIEKQQQTRWNKAQVIIGNINKMDELTSRNIVLTMPEVEAVSKHAEGGTIEIPHIARVLLAKGLIKRVDDAFDKFLTKENFKGIEAFPNPTADDVIAAIHAAGGKAILNHPYTLREDTSEGSSEEQEFRQAEQDQQAEELLQKGMDGLEVYRPYRVRSEEGKKRADARAAKYLLWADKYSKDGKIMVASPGADYHGGDTHQNRLTAYMPKSLAAQLTESLKASNAAAIKALEKRSNGTSLWSFNRVLNQARPGQPARPGGLPFSLVFWFAVAFIVAYVVVLVAS